MRKNTTGLAALVVFLALAAVPSRARADYAMPPLDVVIKTVPLIVDATVTKIDKSGAAHLDIHRVMRGTVEAKRVVVSKIGLTCTLDRGLRGYDFLVGERFVFLLESEDTLYEETTFFEVTGDPEVPASLRILYPHPTVAGERQPQITFAEFLTKTLK